MIQTFKLHSGGDLAYREYGDPAGAVVFFFHGWPGESHQASMLHEAAMARGLRLIAPNRPGIAGSTPQPGRTLLDWPPLVEALADALAVDRFCVLGLSGGGPYALACAWLLGRRLRGTATVCGALPSAPGPDRHHLSAAYRAMLSLHGIAPWALQMALVLVTWLGRFPPPRPLVWLGLQTLGSSDRAALWPKEHFSSYFPAFQNAMRSGMPGLWEDGQPYAAPWPFDPAEIITPLTIWHGTQDRNFSSFGAAALAARIPQALYRETTDGHYSILQNQKGVVLDDLTRMSHA